MDKIVEAVRNEFLERADEKARISGERFFKEEVKIYGLKSAVVRQICRKHYKALPQKDKKTVFALCEKFWKSGYLEDAFMASEWSWYVHQEFLPDDFKTFEQWIGKYISNWAACDTFCNHTVGTFLEMYPEFLSRLKEWAVEENRWMRRAAAVSLIVPAKKGKFLEEILTLADILLMDKEDMVQKGYGWMLKVTSQAHGNEIYRYVLDNKHQMPRTALRYAIEKMPVEWKKEAMKK